MIVPLSDYGPDAADIDSTMSDAILNVIPTPKGYRPLPSLVAFSAALAAEPKGGILARSTDGSYSAFAMTATAAYKTSSTAWTDVTGASGPYTLSADENWSMAVFGNYVIATDLNDDVQYYDLATSSDFADLPGSPPKSRYVAVGGAYVFLASQADYPMRFHRSGTENPEWWTPRQKGSDYQDLPDGGWITGMVGRNRGVIIFQEEAIRTVQDAPGTDYLFTIDKLEGARGCIAPLSIVEVGTRVFYLGMDGFHELGVGPIGAERVDRTFLADCANLKTVQGALDPKQKMVWWLYTDNAGIKKLLGYQWQINKWVPAQTDATFLLTFATPGYTLEELETVLGYTSLDAIPYSLDSSVWKGGNPTFGAFDSTRKLGFFSGPSMEATLETSDMSLGGEGYRAFISGFRPIGDVTGAYGQVAKQDTFGGIRTWNTEAAQNVTGLIPARVSGRNHRFRLRIPAATAWRDALGVEAQVKREGLR